jgi:hypothetical protein
MYLMEEEIILPVGVPSGFARKMQKRIILVFFQAKVVAE